MPKIIVLFNLKAGVDAREYEAWAKNSDVPTVRGLASVQGFDVLRSTTLLGSEAAPPYQYFEIIDVPSLDAFFADVSTDAVQKGAAQFQAFADNPQFIITEDLA
jgi:hypothetical protein